MTVQPIDSTNQASHAPLLAAIRVLTAADRFGRSTSDGSGDDRHELVDRAELATLALAGASADIGDFEAVLAGPLGWLKKDAGPALSAFDSSDFVAVLAAKLTANGPDQRRTPADVDGRGGGVIALN